MEYNIRKYKPKDAEQAVRMNIKVWKTAYSHIFSKEVFEEREKNLEEKIKTFNKKNINPIKYVAESNGKIVATMYGDYVSPKEFFKSQGYAELTVLYVDQDFQHIGLGKKLFDIFVEEIKKKGINKFCIGVLEQNTQGRSAYEKWGGKLSKYTDEYKSKTEVFYTYDVNNLK